MKPIKFAVSLVIYNPKNKNEILAVLRPTNDDSLPNIWGLPSTSVKDGELPEEAAKRVGKEKLATEIELVSRVGIKHSEREHYELILMDVEVKIIGKDPSVKDAVTTGTKYVDQKWTSDLSIFLPGAKLGGICSRILLESKGIDWENKFK